jgi:hypothetical protein
MLMRALSVMAKYFLIVAILLCLSSLSGCFGMTFKADTPNKYNDDKDIIETLYGSTQEDIIREFGEPEQKEKRSKSTFFIYQWKRSDKDILFMIIPVPFPVPVPIDGWRTNSQLYCLYLRFDENNHLIRHATEEPLLSNVHRWFEQESELNCIDWFYPSKLLTPNEIQQQEEARNLAKPGDIDARPGLSSRLYETNWALNKDIKEYCPRAESGDAAAQTYIGDLFYLGSYGLKKNLIQAYVWYSLAANRGIPYANQQVTNLTGELSSNQLIKAKQRLEQRELGQCERDLMEAISEKDE